MAKFFKKWIDKIRAFLDGRGYTCDACGAELFHYPNQRLCADCESKLERASLLFCPKCGRKTRAEGVCLDCKGILPDFTRGFAPFVYRGDTASQINRMKNGKPRLAQYFGEQMAEEFYQKHLSVTLDAQKKEFLIVAIPLTDKRRQERGYNQAERLAEGAANALRAREFSVQIGEGVLIKTKETSMQKHMDATERRKNVEGAYHVHLRKLCKGKTIILIDDILTTGATASECAKRLFGAGAEEVFLLVAAALPERK